MNLGDVESEGSGGFGVLGEWYGGWGCMEMMVDVLGICGFVNVEINGGDSKIVWEESTSFKLVITLYVRSQFSLKSFLS